MMQYDFRGKKVMIGLSGGINSMAVLCELANFENKPDEIYLFYAHFSEHSPDTKMFVEAGVDYARRFFSKVVYETTDNSVLSFFEKIKMIPHPTLSPCSLKLKIEPAYKFAMKHFIQYELVGFVSSEKKRLENALKKSSNELFFSKLYPIIHLSNEDCFEIVKNEIGFYPKIYDIFNKNGKRTFSHNNCLPCKNMTLNDLKNVQKHYPDFFEKAQRLTEYLQKHWGRSKIDYYTTFGKEDFESDKSCKSCSFN